MGVPGQAVDTPAPLDWHHVCSYSCNENQNERTWGNARAVVRQRRGATHGAWCIHSDRQQRVADLDDIAAIPADLRSEPRDRTESRALRLRFRAVDDQAARVWRPVAVLGLQPGILHSDGGAGSG